eukprot:3166173-Rhodomonas_salina.1
MRGQGRWKAEQMKRKERQGSHRRAGGREEREGEGTIVTRSEHAQNHTPEDNCGKGDDDSYSAAVMHLQITGNPS